MRAVITLLQKEKIRLLEISREAHRYQMQELYEDIDQTIVDISDVIILIKKTFK